MRAYDHEDPYEMRDPLRRYPELVAVLNGSEDREVMEEVPLPDSSSGPPSMLAA